MISLISASTRANSQSLKVTNRLAQKLTDLSIENNIIDLHALRLPLYDDTDQDTWKAMSQQLENSDACVWVVPEWNGTAGPGIMNVLTYLDNELDHKPVLLVSVSSGAGAAYPLALLKGFGGKNSKAVFIPEQLRFRDVKTVFNAAEPEVDNHSDHTMHERSQYALAVLNEYAQALKKLREGDVLDVTRYHNGF